MHEENNKAAVKSLLVSICFQNQHWETTNWRGASVWAKITMWMFLLVISYLLSSSLMRPEIQLSVKHRWIKHFIIISTHLSVIYTVYIYILLHRKHPPKLPYPSPVLFQASSWPAHANNDRKTPRWWRVPLSAISGEVLWVNHHCSCHTQDSYVTTNQNHSHHFTGGAHKTRGCDGCSLWLWKGRIFAHSLSANSGLGLLISAAPLLFFLQVRPSFPLPSLPLSLLSLTLPLLQARI